ILGPTPSINVKSSALAFAAFLGAAFSFFSSSLASTWAGFAFLAAGFSAFAATLAFGSATATASSSNGNTETNDLLLAFLRKTTLPSMSANSVWSFPIPTFTSGWCCVPRWRTMIFPAMARWPPNIFTPKRLLCDSRPFFELPAPFLCALSYLLFMMGHRPVKQFGLSCAASEFNLGELLAVAIFLLVPLTALFLENDYLVTF